jgi:hypothetical protein
MAEDLVEKVFSFFSGDSNANLSDKELILRDRIKELSENKYAKFFRTKTDEADPALGHFFFALYKIILPIRTFMRDTAKTTRLRQIVLEAFMDAGIVETVKRLSPTDLEERVKKLPPQEMAAEIRADIDKLVTAFSANRVNRINQCYNMVMVIFQLAYFDYPGLLKKFDSNFAEGPFAGDPRFSPVKSASVVKELSDFLAVTQHITPDNDWKTLLKLLHSCAGKELISENQLAQMLIGLRDIIHSKVLELIVQCGSKNPVWVCKPKIPDEHIAEQWLESKTGRAQDCIDKINNTEIHKQINGLLKEIFDHNEFVSLENYTLAKGDVYRKKGLSHFSYAEGLNYLSVFMNDYMGKDIQELYDILLIRGQWTNNNYSKEMSESLHQLLELPKQIAHMDEMLSDDGPDGSRLKAAYIRVDRDRTQVRYINSIIDSCNESAAEIINIAIQHFSVIERHLNNLMEDVQKKHPEMMVNWRELNSVSKDPLAQRMVNYHKKVACFTQLLNLCLQ